MKVKISKFVHGLPNLSAKSYFLLDLLSKNKKNLVFITKNEEDLSDYANALMCLPTICDVVASEVPSKISEQKPKFKIITWSNNIMSKAASAKSILDALENKETFIFIATPQSIRKGIIPLETFKKLQFSLELGKNYPRGNLITNLQKSGYFRTNFVENPGEFAVRGSIVDIFSPDFQKPVRLFFSDVLESIREFEIDTQHTSSSLEKITIIPCLREPDGISTDCLTVGSSNILNDWLKTDFEIVFDSNLGDETFIDFKDMSAIQLTELAQNNDSFDFGAVSNIDFHSNFDILIREIKRLKQLGFDITIFCLNKGEEERILELFLDKEIHKHCRFKTGYLFSGFIHNSSKKVVITSSEIFKRRYHVDTTDFKIKTRRFKLFDLKVGDFIVHEDMGIGKYLGIKKVRNRIKDSENFEEIDCLYIEYARGDKLLVPMYEFAKVQKYISSHGKIPKLSNLDSKTWSEVKNRVREEVHTLAKEILRIEAERLALDIAPMNEENYLEREFADSFPFEETPDQKSAIEDVLSDMSKSKPMNRLIVGDVGFGKTEVAMRAAMRCVLSGKQVAMLVPTTILADQHFRTFSDRFRGFPLNISVISRFVSKAKQKKILENLATGICDIIIGTHRLLQSDVRFKDLGLLIIDEEHRFGVKDKEKLKIMAKGVHVLMLSATPIPRTLYQSLSSLKSMSVIESPPIGRLPITTIVKPFCEKTAANAINFELSRNGQVYYVHNRVCTIESKMQFLQKLVPDARICIVHGQMKSSEIEKHMWDFLNKKYEILLASTIIESGLDIPSVNTLIVEDAHELGLAQLYQLRGRIGREKQKAYCYLFYPAWLKNVIAPVKPQSPDSPSEVVTPTVPQAMETCSTKQQMTENAVRRMAALQEFTELGSGFRLAMRDLEIRGAGELLGTRQHGFINSVGLEFYVKLLNNEINKLQGKKTAFQEEVNIDLKIPTFIPEDYINDDMERLNFYKKLLNAPAENIEKIVHELEDISGPAPEPLKNLSEVLKLRKMLLKYSIRSVVQKENSIEIFFNQKSPITPDIINKWHRQYRDSIIFLPSKLGDGIRITKTENPLKTIKQIVESL